MKFDWYAATINDSPQNVVACLKSTYGEDLEIERATPMHGYHAAANLVGRNGVCVRVLHGGANGAPHAWASGECTQPFVDAVRRSWGGGKHYVTRFDAAEDFDKPQAFEELQMVALSYADSHRLKVSQAGDWYRLVDGRTTYVGSRKSPVFIRLYEKGKQLRSQVSTGAEAISPDWVRLEAQVRPQKHARLEAATASPMDAWGFSSWTRELCQEVFSMDVPRVDMHVWREADDDRALQFMCRQYGSMLSRLKADLGDWECVGKQIGEAVFKQRSAARMRK